ncbi:hypothetical protein BD310DRAFT_923900 [Dichomitus squalens]|uniref:Uncharacterized protein n=1 Tax=Dichomitus squalens TaxID=114155 RepID=A0A4Q9PYY4_9APHY|nr:hypothetical protein BD310DRAFT_923900 [Dichomitus squalens]
MPAQRSEPHNADDTGFMAAVAAQMQSSWEKKRREKESKFVRHAKEELDKCLLARIEEYTAAVTEINGAYDKFVFEYAQVEDHIRKLWLELQQEQQALLVTSEKRHKLAVEREGEREKGQVKGMAMAKKAVQDFSAVISSLEDV